MTAQIVLTWIADALGVRIVRQLHCVRRSLMIGGAEQTTK